ncbi:unnamed protein product [Pseudo-nitzschia multistriata]|uniref:Uncharacterized protein n=1 Tax=Pseudo-nitzschia multistriata TaxID=183589 RepID=A0A448Z2L4_9STRA|nr:unnamed protein product [Pseudo-nitzschia multistriata]
MGVAVDPGLDFLRMVRMDDLVGVGDSKDRSAVDSMGVVGNCTSDHPHGRQRDIAAVVNRSGIDYAHLAAADCVHFEPHHRLRIRVNLGVGLHLYSRDTMLPRLEFAKTGLSNEASLFLHNIDVLSPSRVRIAAIAALMMMFSFS